MLGTAQRSGTVPGATHCRRDCGLHNRENLERVFCSNLNLSPAIVGTMLGHVCCAEESQDLGR
jgi:hypothetical protein